MACASHLHLLQYLTKNGMRKERHPETTEGRKKEAKKKKKNLSIPLEEYSSPEEVSSIARLHSVQSPITPAIQQKNLFL
jgi:hypothetical protein